jgi:hypothetical protein
MKYDYHESHKHKLAKELLWKWLNNIDKDNIDYSQEHNIKLPFYWRTGNYGVHMELPFHKTDSPYYFELSKGLLVEECIASDGSKYSATSLVFDPLIDRGELLFVPDITIFHKGTAIILIEVVHTSSVSQQKIDKILSFFEGYHIEVYEIEADNILDQTNKKCDLKFTKLI